MTFLCIFTAWLFTLCLHEFSHAYVAYHAGDHSVKDKGYLSFNPLRYTHPVMSIVFPLIILAMGGIALPGGAVYIDRTRLRTRKWESLVSLAGPISNLCVAGLLSLAFITGFYERLGTQTFWAGYAFFIFIQVMAAVLNLLPVPPLDGYGAIEPWLDWRTRLKLQPLRNYGILILFLLLWFFEPFYRLFYAVIMIISSGVLRVPRELIIEGLNNFRLF